MREIERQGWIETERERERDSIPDPSSPGPPPLGVMRETQRKRMNGQLNPVMRERETRRDGQANIVSAATLMHAESSPPGDHTCT